MCPKCGRHLATAKYDLIREADRLHLDNFSYHGFTPVAGGPMVCPDDQAGYSQAQKGKLKIHTKGGWR